MNQQQIQRLAELVRGIESAMFTTINPDGSINSRPMVVQDFDFDGELWFFTHRESGKVDAIVEDSHVCLAFMDPGNNRYVSMSGKAEVVDDSWTMRRMWSNAFERWFPEGPSDEGLALIRVRVDHAEYWDAPHSEVMETFCFTDPVVKASHRHAGRLSEDRHFHSW